MLKYVIVSGHSACNGADEGQAGSAAEVSRERTSEFCLVSMREIVAMDPLLETVLVEMVTRSMTRRIFVMLKRCVERGESSPCALNRSCGRDMPDLLLWFLSNIANNRE